ncbi:TPA: hypothetical protein HA249_04875 [Candidatus Woesearchaeota archaeon]|nr:MAG: hypothetical protein QT07_C0001G0011 [archaeon GW2011_AR16]HIG96188.1 hypothetical protein [Candidatus Woesearchaeota archaeon]HIH47022.1 hypothetical protein [Candidatus Woesearchaeota archaeon]HII88566.1 hypothetical protein [Candidatus Woesearchaeota archaeon]
MESFFEVVKRTIQKNQDVLAMFEEYDRTHHLRRKINYKIRMNVTLDENLVQELRTFCNQHQLKMSTWIESVIRKELKR